MPHLKHLQKDSTFKTIIGNQPKAIFTPKKNICLRLCASIISQQLSTKVASVIFDRFLSLYKSKSPSAKTISQTEIASFRAIGLSTAKANYVHNVCAFFIANKITDARLHAMKDEDIIALLTQIKGVGIWTVQMILIFSLHREDVFAIDDLVVQQSIIKTYKLPTTNKKILRETLLQISQQWKPYRSYACKYLWGYKDDTALL